MVFLNTSLGSNVQAFTKKTRFAARFKSDYETQNTQKGLWEVKENFADYVEKRVPSLTKYMDNLERTPQEEAVMEKLKADFLNIKEKRAAIFPASTSVNRSSFWLTDREIQAFHDLGIVGPISIKSLSSEALSAIFSKYTGVTNTLGTKGYRDVRVRQEWVSPEILDLACNQEIVSKVSAILGKDIKIRFTGIHEVAPGTGGFAAATDDKIASLCAHSDMNLGARLSKVGLSGPLVDTDSINVWISITETNPNNAPLFLFPKTHNWPILTPYKYLEHVKEDPEALQKTLKLLSTAEFGSEIVANHALFYNYLQTSPLKEELSKIRRVEIYTKPGECLIFSTHLQHGSDINYTDKPRLGISVRYSSATGKENGDTTRLVSSLFSKEEKRRLGMDENDTRAPILQIAGSKHHENSVPINRFELRKILVERAQGRE